MDLSASDPTGIQLLIVGIVGLAGLVFGLVGLLLCPRRGWSLLGLLLALLLFAAATLRAVVEFPFSIRVALSVLGAVTLIGSALRWEALARPVVWLVRRAQNPRLQGLVFLGLSAGFVGWWIHQIEAQVPIVDEPSRSDPLAIDPSQLREAKMVTVLTDRNRPVPVFTLPAEAQLIDLLPRHEQDMVRQRDLAQKQIRTAAPDLNCNCHGWVFAAGNFWVRGEHVARILEDNGYQKVSIPREGDVIIYTDEAGTILHSGRVRTVAPDALVLVESKWGPMGRYIHQPRDQVYSQSWTYYHTDRGYHRLRGVGGETPRGIGLQP